MKDTNKRFVFIQNIVGWEGQINATHIKNSNDKNSPEEQQIVLTQGCRKNLKEYLLS